MADTTLEVLEMGFSLIKNKAHWCQYSAALTASGRVTEPERHNATRFCALGAVLSVRPVYGYPAVNEAIHLLADAASQMGFTCITVVNDGEGHEKVIEMYELAMHHAANIEEMKRQCETQ